MSLDDTTAQIILREWFREDLIEPSVYWNLQQVSHYVRAVINYLLPPLRAKRHFTLISHRELEDRVCEAEVLPCGDLHGYCISTFEDGVKWVYYYFRNELLSIRIVDPRPTADPREYCVTHGTLNISAHIFMDEYSPYWNLETNGIQITSYDIHQPVFVLGCRLSDHAKIREKPKASGYVLVIDLKFLTVKMAYKTSQFYSLVKDKDFLDRLHDLNVVEDDYVDAKIREFANHYGWKNLDDE